MIKTFYIQLLDIFIKFIYKRSFVMKKFLSEFKEFAMKGNVLDMAIGVVIGASFSSIVSSLVNDIFMPLIAVLTGDVQFSELKLVLKGTGDNAVTINYGSFIQNIVNFLIVALCLFLVVKTINKFKSSLVHEKQKEKEEPKPSDELVALNKIVELLEDKK